MRIAYDFERTFSEQREKRNPLLKNQFKSRSGLFCAKLLDSFLIKLVD